MANREIYKIKIVACVNPRWWYADLVGKEYYVVILPNNDGKIRFTPINKMDGQFILYDDAEVLEKVTKVELPRN